MDLISSPQFLKGLARYDEKIRQRVYRKLELTSIEGDKNEKQSMAHS
jgi:phosphopantetheinyl transferase (holo-ACP synthase)